MPRKPVKKQSQASLVNAVVRAIKRADNVKGSGGISGSGNYRRKKIRGSGDYAPGEYANKVGNDIGSKVGSFIGGAAGKLFHQLTGLGNYRERITSNSMLISSKNDGIPNMHGDGNGGIRVQRCEFLGNVLGSIDFTNVVYNINPTDSVTFPWLSRIASNFEQYKPHGIVFEYRTMSSDTQIGSTVSLGQVIMATEYNSLANKFVTPVEMLNSQWAESLKPSLSQMHFIECAGSMTPNLPLYCRDQNDVAGGDVRLYDLAKFQLATQGMTATGDGQIIGQLWISYDMSLLKPVITDEEVFEYATHETDTIGLGVASATNPINFGLGHKYSNFGLNMGINPVSNSIYFNPVLPVSQVAIDLIWSYQTAQLSPSNGPVVTYFNCTATPVIIYGNQASHVCSDLGSFVLKLYISPIDETKQFGVTLGLDMTFTNKADLDIYAFAMNPNVL